MTKVSEKDKKEFQRNKEVINIKEFMLLKSGEQDKQIEESLNKVYEEKVEINKKYIDKVLNVAFDNKDNETYLPHSLCVQKDGNKLVFSFKKNNKALVILFLLGFLFISGFATFSGVRLLSASKLNIDINGDGVAELNLDTNDDGVCELNCTDNIADKKPEYNITYGKLMEAKFNVKVKGEDGTVTIFNPINQKNADGVCILNCDTDDDGWPDINIDLDGDGVADINIDVDNDGSPDLNIDTNGDGVADINLDTNNDGTCDSNCTYVVSRDGQATIGDGTASVDVAALVVTFTAGNDVVVNDLYPDDQNEVGANTKVDDVKFSIENKTTKTLKYKLSWIDVENTFETDNFWSKIESTNNGYSKDWFVAPRENSIIMESVEIPANTIQEYTVSFTLHGTGVEQNEDQGKIFKGRIQVNLLSE